MYSEEAEFWHPLFIVKGKENIFGAHMFWSFINRKTNAKVKRIGNAQIFTHVQGGMHSH